MSIFSHHLFNVKTMTIHRVFISKNLNVDSGVKLVLKQKQIFSKIFVWKPNGWVHCTQTNTHRNQFKIQLKALSFIQQKTWPQQTIYQISVSKHFCGVNVCILKSRLVLTSNNVIWFFFNNVISIGPISMHTVHLSRFCLIYFIQINAIWMQLAKRPWQYICLQNEGLSRWE